MLSAFYVLSYVRIVYTGPSSFRRYKTGHTFRSDSKIRFRLPHFYHNLSRTMLTMARNEHAAPGEWKAAGARTGVGLERRG